MSGDQAASSSPGRKRIRNPEIHRSAILAAAREVFAQRGYGKATLREIARRAGVAHGLLTLHFSTKENLFVTSIFENRRVEDAIDGDAEGLPERIARGYVERIETGGASDPFIAVVRSAGDPDIARRLLMEMRREPLDAFASVLDVPDLDRRADVLGSLLVGVAFHRYVFAVGPIAEMAPEDLISHLTPAIRTILTGPLD